MKLNEIKQMNDKELKIKINNKIDDYRRMKDNFDSKVDVLTKIETQQKRVYKIFRR